MRIVFVTQKVDPDDPILGATVAKIRELARRCDEVVVLTDGAVPGVLPVNCVVRSFAAGSRLGRGARYGSLLLRELLRRPRPDALVAHMCPVYAILGWPLAAPLRVRRVLWYTHWRRTPALVVAARLVDAIASVDARSVPLASRKVVPIGHGIEVPEGGCADQPASGGLRLLFLGRYAEAKGVRVILRGVALARERGVEVRLTCHGTATVPAEETEQAHLEELVGALGLEGVAEILGPVPRAEVPALLAGAGALVNNMREGAADKVVFEAGGACRPVLASNPSFRPLLDGLGVDLLFRREDPDSLAAAIEALAALGPEGRQGVGSAIRERVVAGHSVGAWVERLLAVCRG